MSKVTLLLGSFMVGALSMLLLFGIHTSMVVQPSSAFAMGGIVMRSLIPTVPGLGPPMTKDSFTGGNQQLDGLNCGKCAFKNMTLTYGGGAYNIPAFTFDHVRIQLVGASANTVRVLMLMQAMRSLPANPPVQPKAGIEISTPINAPAQTVQLIGLSGMK
jgi:hypothetical protein